MRPVEEKTFPTHDGVELFYRHWPATAGAARGAIVLFHRGHEHSGRMAHLADELDLPDFAFFAWDARGHGRSPGERGFSPSLGTSVRDVQTFVEHIATTYGIAAEDIAVVAQSVGAVLVADLGARLRAEHPLHGARLAGLQGEALRAVRAQRTEDHAQAARQLLRQLLRQGEIPHPRSRAHRVLRRRSADRAPDRRQHPARRSTRRPSAWSPTPAPSPSRRSS